MALQFREGWITFPTATGRRQRVSSNVTFSGNINSYQVVMKGYNIRYDNGDHHVLELELDLDSSRSGNNITVNGDFVLRDSSGNYDDPYEGWINFVVMADVN
ncbi:MAG: hypothetical protein GY727_03175 [Gammaproteobacteria bacterium]|nr:hypothetical protein [Gammaproteobacteria bacterium]